jgi:hypothetical protein
MRHHDTHKTKVISSECVARYLYLYDVVAQFFFLEPRIKRDKFDKETQRDIVIFSSALLIRYTSRSLTKSRRSKNGRPKSVEKAPQDVDAPSRQSNLLGLS